MLINNGQITEEINPIISHNNKALTHGHSIVEEMRIMGGQIIFWEAHYLKIMASMRMLRITIPMDFTPEKLSDLILDALAKSPVLKQDALVRFQVFPNEIALRETQYYISLTELRMPQWQSPDKTPFEMGLYKDYYVSNNGLSALPTSNRLIAALAHIFAFENDFQACFLLNTNKEVIGSNRGTLYMLLEGEIHTPPLSGGTKDSVFRKKMNQAIEKDSSYVLKTDSISPFSLQKASALCILNVSDGLISVSKYRKKTYEGDDFYAYMTQLLAKAAQEALV